MNARKPISLSTAVLFILSLVYLGMELVFNTRLLDVASSVRASPDEVETVQHFGRVASGVGFTLLIIGVFQRFRFRITSLKQWLLFSAVAFLCLLPFLASFGQIVFGLFADNSASYLNEIFWCIVPFIGIFLIVSNKGRTPFIVILGLVIMAWPTMFYGQKLALEHYLISPTTAEDRLNANYILLLRTGIEDCILPLEGVSLCDRDGDADVERRSVRSLLGALFMLNSPAVLNSLSTEQDQIIGKIATQGLWFSPREYYQLSLQQVAAERRQYEALLEERYYQPYKKASDAYSERPDPTKAAKEFAAKIETAIDRWWLKYQETVANLYRYSLMDKTVNMAKKVASHRFFNKTGYPPDLQDRLAFIQNIKTQKLLGSDIEQAIQDEMNEPGFRLPPGWKYETAAFRNYIESLIRQKSQRAWHIVQAQFKTDIPPGLTRAEFFRHLGIPPLPPMEALTIPENEFMQKYTIPMNKKASFDVLEDIRRKAASYGNAGAMAEQGKDYIRVLYIPAIALCTSLLLVVLTVGKNMANVICFATGEFKITRLATWAIFLAGVMFLPYLWPNAYVASPAYQKYLSLAKERSVVPAFVLDWVVHMQPIIYRAGSPLMLSR